MIGRLLQHVREQLGLTRAQVAQSLTEAGQPATEAELAGYEAGECFPPLDLLRALGPVFGLPAALAMERASLKRLPKLVPPAGCRIRPCRKGDASEWCRLINESMGGPYDEAGFVEYQLLERGMGQWPARPEEFVPDGLYFAECEGQAVGTACALWRTDIAEERGSIHMVVVTPEHRGRGVGRALVIAALRHLRARGLSRAALLTDDHRLPAIRLYLSLGFRPEFTEESHPARWAEVERQLKEGSLAS